jgi:hypothetical protein
VLNRAAQIADGLRKAGETSPFSIRIGQIGGAFGRFIRVISVWNTGAEETGFSKHQGFRDSAAAICAGCGTLMQESSEASSQVNDGDETNQGHFPPFVRNRFNLPEMIEVRQ